MTLETAIEENTIAINQLIERLGTLTVGNITTTASYQKQKAIVDEVLTPDTPVNIAADPNCREVLREKFLTARNTNAVLATKVLKGLLEEYEVSTAKDLALEAVPNFIERFGQEMDKAA